MDAHGKTDGRSLSAFVSPVSLCFSCFDHLLDVVFRVPESFDDDWVEKTCSGIDDQSNWRVKANGLKKLLKSVLQCYNQLTGQPVSDEHVPDVLAAGKNVLVFGR